MQHPPAEIGPYNHNGSRQPLPNRLKLRLQGASQPVARQNLGACRIELANQRNAPIFSDSPPVLGEVKDSFMPRPSTLPEPWVSLAIKLGGVNALAKSLGTVPRTINDWANGIRTPRGPAWKLIQRVFADAGIQEPPRLISEKVHNLNPTKLLDEVTDGVYTFLSPIAIRNGDCDMPQGLLRASAAIAKVEANVIALDRAALAVSIDLLEAHGSLLKVHMEHSENLMSILEDRLQEILGHLRGNTGDAERCLIELPLKNMEWHRRNAIDAIHAAWKFVQQRDSVQSLL